MNNEQAAQQVMEWLRSSTEFVETQAPILANEIIRYIVVTRSIALGALLVGFVASSIVTVKLLKKAKKLAEDPTYEEGLIFGLASLVSGGFAALFAYFGVAVLDELIRALLAPRMVIIEVLTNQL